MNVWSPTPSPPLDALGAPSTSTSSALLVAWHIALALPRRLCDAYVAYLWYFEPDSWVGRVASTFRILAIVLVLPVVLLTLLDVTSYVIARTLGIVDDVKASTSDALGPGTHSTADGGRPVAVVAVAVSATSDSAASARAEGGTSARTSEGLAPEDSLGGQTGDEDEHGCAGAVRVVLSCSSGGTVAAAQTDGIRTRMHSADEGTPQTYYFVGEEHLGLAGEGLFSPAVSGPPSPLTPCMQLHSLSEGDGAKASGEEETALRRRVQGVREDESVHT